MNNDKQHYELDDRGGIIAIIDLHHPEILTRTNVLSDDSPWVVASWHGTYNEEKSYWELEPWQIEKARNLHKLLNNKRES